RRRPFSGELRRDVLLLRPPRRALRRPRQRVAREARRRPRAARLARERPRAVLEVGADRRLHPPPALRPEARVGVVHERRRSGHERARAVRERARALRPHPPRARPHGRHRLALRLALAHLRVSRSRIGRAEEAPRLRSVPSVPEPRRPPRDRTGARAAGRRERRADAPRVLGHGRNSAAAANRRRIMKTPRYLALAFLAFAAGFAVSSARGDEPRVVPVTAKRFEFQPNEIHVAKGEDVVLEVTSQDVTHGFFSRKFGFDEDLPPGKTV